MPEALLDRRMFLGAAITGVAGSLLRAHVSPASAVESSPPSNSLGIPGPFPGRVVEVHHPGSVVHDRVEREPVRDMVSHGMRELTGAPDPTDAWRRLFEPGDVVGSHRQPQHIVLAAALGLGVFDRAKIDYRRLELGDGSAAHPHA